MNGTTCKPIETGKPNAIPNKVLTHDEPENIQPPERQPANSS